MNALVWSAKKKKLAEEADSLERQMDGVRKKLEAVREKLAFMEELEMESAPYGATARPATTDSAPHPVPKLADAARAAAKQLRRFTKRQLAQQMMENHPKLDFNIKSLDRVLKDMLEGGDLKALGKDATTPANIYEFTGRD